jgi:hypothetical protein
MDYGTLEVEIADYLGSKINTGVTNPTLHTACVPLPEMEADFKKPFIGRRVTVCFSEEKPDKTKSTAYQAQSLMVTFSCLLEAKLLRGERGIYQLAEKVKSILIGYSLTDCGDLALTNHQFVDDEQSIFKHVLEFQCTALRAQDVSGAEVGENDFTGLVITD